MALHVNALQIQQLTKSRAATIYGGMSGMFRFASSAAALFFRLVIIVSLAGYSLSAVNAAMHPGQIAEVVSVEADHADHAHGHSEMAAKDTPSDHHGSIDKTSKKTCCDDYCGVTVIDCGSSSLTHPRLEIARAFIDDTHQVGLAPSLHLPPNI